MFAFLASVATQRRVALDLATGNGQAVIALTEHFEHVIALDASSAQIDAAVSHPGVRYGVAKAEQTGLADATVDLVTVAQAFHWFDEAVFMREAERVATADGVLAIWCYRMCRVNPECDAIVDRLYTDIVGEFWPRERSLIEKGYAEVRMPGKILPVPDIEMVLDWSVTDMLGYLRTWSAAKRYESAKGHDPVSLVEAELQAAWGDGQLRAIWPLEVKVSRINRLPEDC